MISTLFSVMCNTIDEILPNRTGPSVFNICPKWPAGPQIFLSRHSVSLLVVRPLMPGSRPTTADQRGSTWMEITKHATLAKLQEVVVPSNGSSDSQGQLGELL